MSEKESGFTLEFLNNNIYPKLKQKIKTLSFQVEFNTLMNLVKDMKAMRTFIVREMHGFLAVYKDNQKEFSTKDEFFMIFPKKKTEILELNEFFHNNFNSRHLFVNNIVLKGKLIYNEEWEKYKKVIYRFELQNKGDDMKSNKKKSVDIKNEIINNDNEDIYFLDSIFSFYLDINNSSTILINELYYNLEENEINRFCDILNIYFEKANNFINKNLNMYLCTESTLINRSMTQIFNYIISRKLFYHKKFEIKEIQKFKDEVNIFVDVKDQIYPDSYFQCRCHILKLSDISCFVSVIALIDVKHFSFSKRFLMLKSAIIIFLKKLKKKIESELIEN
jgi:hypothetical protein